MTQPTRSEMLDSIKHKIARTGGRTGPCETGYFLPVMIGDVLDWIENNDDHPNEFGFDILNYWKTKREPLSAQDDDCIAYVHSLI